MDFDAKWTLDAADSQLFKNLTLRRLLGTNDELLGYKVEQPFNLKADFNLPYLVDGYRSNIRLREPEKNDTLIRITIVCASGKNIFLDPIIWIPGDENSGNILGIFNGIFLAIGGKESVSP